MEATHEEDEKEENAEDEEWCAGRQLGEVLGKAVA